MPTITTRLLRAAADVSPIKPIALDADGTAIEINVPAGLELVEAALAVRLPDDSTTLDLLASAAATTSAGAAANPTTPATWGAIAWVMFDWRTRRGLLRLDVTIPKPAAVPLPPGVPAPPPPMLRLRVSDGGPWVLATPVALAALTDQGASLGASVQLPGISASRIMLEVVTRPATALGPEDHVPASTTFTSVRLSGSRRPPGLTVSVAPTTIVHHEPGLLPPSAILEVRESLLAALRHAIPGTAGGGARIVLRSPGDASLTSLTLTLASRPELTRWLGDRAELELPIGPGLDAYGLVELSDHPTAFAARVEAQLRRERPPIVATPALTGYAHRCSPDSALAQCFGFTQAAPLVGVDLMLAPRTPVVRGRVTLHADEHGAPAEPPLALLPIDLPANDPHAPPDWRSLDLAKPLLLAPGAPVWVVLTLSTGAADWALAPRPDATPVRGLLRRERGESWVPRDMSFAPGPNKPWALARPRLRREGPPPALAISLRRGAVSVPLVADPEGRVALDAAGLAPLIRGDPKLPLELLVRGAITGRVRLYALRVTLPVQRETTLFPR